MISSEKFDDLGCCYEPRLRSLDLPLRSFQTLSRTVRPDDSMMRLKNLGSPPPYISRLMVCSAIFIFTGCAPRISEKECWSTAKIRASLNEATIDVPASATPIALARGIKPGSPLPGLHRFRSKPSKMVVATMPFCQDRNHVPIHADAIAARWPSFDQRLATSTGVRAITLTKLPAIRYGRPAGAISFPLIKIGQKINGSIYSITYRDSAANSYETTCTARIPAKSKTLHGACVFYSITRGIGVDTVVYTNLADPRELPTLIEAEHAVIGQWINQ